jgi:hypothetical protein
VTLLTAVSEVEVEDEVGESVILTNSKEQRDAPFQPSQPTGPLLDSRPFLADCRRQSSSYQDHQFIS